MDPMGDLNLFWGPKPFPGRAKDLHISSEGLQALSAPGFPVGKNGSWVERLVPS